MGSTVGHQKLKTRLAILQSAAELIRERGIGGAGVAAVMGRAGLTVGGFYAHFESKEALVEEALLKSGNDMLEGARHGVERLSRRGRLLRLVNGYLSEAHVANAIHGCALPSVVYSVLFGEESLRGTLEQLVTKLTDELATPFGHGKKARARALGCVALMIGGISLARAFRGTPLSGEVLEATRMLARDVANAAKL